MNPFVVFALPRSRSAWLAHFLTYGAWRCGHDTLLDCDSLDDVRARLAEPCTGYVETAAASFWRLLKGYAPGARIVTLRRPVPDVVASLLAAGLVFDDAVMTRLLHGLERKLDQIEARCDDVLSVRFADLADEAVCAEVFEHCLPYRHDAEWWREMDATNVQMNMLWFAQTLPRRQQQFLDLGAQATRAHRRERVEA